MSTHWHTLKLPPRQTIPFWKADGITRADDCYWYDVEMIGYLVIDDVGGNRCLGFWRDSISQIVFFAEYSGDVDLRIGMDGACHFPGAWVHPDQVDQVGHYIQGWQPGYHVYDREERAALAWRVRSLMDAAPKESPYYEF